MFVGAIACNERQKANNAALARPLALMADCRDHGNYGPAIFQCADEWKGWKYMSSNLQRRQMTEYYQCNEKPAHVTSILNT
jgi:hypothetical protein